MFTTGAPYSIGRRLLGQLPLANRARFRHHVRHKILAPSSGRKRQIRSSRQHVTHQSLASFRIEAFAHVSLPRFARFHIFYALWLTAQGVLAQAFLEGIRTAMRSGEQPIRPSVPPIHIVQRRPKAFHQEGRQS